MTPLVDETLVTPRTRDASSAGWEFAILAVTDNPKANDATLVSSRTRVKTLLLQMPYCAMVMRPGAELCGILLNCG